MSRKTLWWIAGGVAGFLVVLYVVGYVATGLWMPRSTVIGGVDVSGMRPAAAVITITNEFADNANDEVSLVRDDKQFTIAPENLDMKLNASASVYSVAGKHSFNPLTMIRLISGGGRHPLVIDYDAELMEAEVESIAVELDQPEVEPLITFENQKPIVRQPADGFRVKQPLLITAITSAYMHTTDPQIIPMGVTHPAVGKDGVQIALTNFAEPAMSAPVRLNINPGAHVIELQPTVYETALRMEVVDGALKPIIDPEILAEPLANATKEIGTPAKDAQIVIKDNKPVIIDGTSGRGVNPVELSEKLIGPLAMNIDARVLDLIVGDVDPTFSTADAQSLKIVEKVSTFTTYYPPTTYRDINQGLAASKINGTILKPGEEFSLNTIVGERTAANGFVKGGVIEGGKFTTSYGGGVSQVATTTYNAAFFAGLEFLEFKAHSVYISRYPMGREATVNWPNVDLRFKNNTPYGILITAHRVKSAGRSRGELSVSMWSTKYWTIKASQSAQRNWRQPPTIKDKSKDCEPQEPTAGFDVDVTRTWIQNDEVIRRETVTTRYNAAAKIVCVTEEE